MQGWSDKRIAVCGSGMAGLAAAVTAAERGARVVVFEKAPGIGGTTAMSSGLVWTFADIGELMDAIPDGNPALQAVVFNTVDEGRDWLAACGVEMGPEESLIGHGRGRTLVDPRQAVEALAGRLRELGGTIELDTALEELRTDGGRVIGLRVGDGTSRHTMAADAVVLATGGFQGNPELVTRYIVPSTDNLYLRANPWSSGDGLLSALAVGGAATPGMDTFYGHPMLAPPASFSDKDFLNVTQWQGASCVALNLLGRRFVDESTGTGGEVLNQELARQPKGRGFYVLDSRTAGMDLMGGFVNARVILERAQKYHGVVLQADTLEELCQRMQEHGVPGGGAERTLNEYNRAIAAGEGASLSPQRLRKPFPVTVPPFFAVSVKASITLTMGGIAVDEQMRVVRRSGATSLLAQSLSDPSLLREPVVEGLYAAGCDVGNINHRNYMGSLSVALTTGRRAGAAAAGPGPDEGAERR